MVHRIRRSGGWQFVVIDTGGSVPGGRHYIQTHGRKLDVTKTDGRRCREVELG